jgi:hypothetical protein
VRYLTRLGINHPWGRGGGLKFIKIERNKRKREKKLKEKIVKLKNEAQGPNRSPESYSRNKINFLSVIGR